jgi:hypothetical protein
MVYEILEDGRVKIGLQNTIGAIHMTESANVQDLIVAAGIMTGSRAFLKKCAAVTGQVKGFLALLYRIRSR